MDLKNPHDLLFKETWSHREAARSFFRHYIPAELLSHINLNELHLCTESLVEEDLKEYRCDMLYRTEIDGNPGYVYFLLEHKSYADPDVSLQLLGYMSRIWRLHRKQQGNAPLPVIVPLVIYHGREPWNAGDDFVDRFDHPAPCFLRHIPDFQFVLIDLSHFSDAEIRGEVMLRTALMLFKHVFMPDYQDRLPGIFALLKALVEKDTGMQYIETVIRYVFSTMEGIDAGALKKVVEESLSKEKGELIMTLAESLFNQGLQQGMQQGMQQGIQQGMQQGMQQGIDKGICKGRLEGLLIAIELGLELKFGSRALGLMESIRQLNDPERLLAIRDAIRIGATLQDVEEIITASPT